MGANLFTRVWDEYPGGGSTLVLMLAIGKSADRQGHWTVSWSELLIAARMSYSSAVRGLEELRSSDWILHKRVPGRKGTLSIQLNPSRMRLADTHRAALPNSPETHDQLETDGMLPRKALEPRSTVPPTDATLEGREVVHGEATEAVADLPPSSPDEEQYQFATWSSQARLRSQAEQRRKGRPKPW